MSIIDFELSNNSTIKIKGSHFDYKALVTLNNILKKLKQNNKVKKVDIVGNFDTQLLINDIFAKKKYENLNDVLLLLQTITKTIEDSNIIYTAFIDDLAQGPALEIAMSCNFIKAKSGTTLNFNFTNYEQIPFFGTIQRIIRIIGYKKALELLLINKTLDFKEANSLNIINNKTDNTIYKKRPFWDQTFTNTFIFFNSKIHSKYQNKNLAYNAILSIIFESSICEYDIGMSIEKRWLKWLMLKKLEKT